MIKRILAVSVISLILGSLILVPVVEAAGPRSWGKWGTATTSNAVLTVGGSSSPFGPANVCVYNSGATNPLYFDWTDGIATIDDDSTNIRVDAGVAVCVDFHNENVSNVVEVGIITASSTTSYVVSAFAAR